MSLEWTDLTFKKPLYAASFFSGDLRGLTRVDPRKVQGQNIQIRTIVPNLYFYKNRIVQARLFFDTSGGLTTVDPRSVQGQNIQIRTIVLILYFYKNRLVQARLFFVKIQKPLNAASSILW